jgi:uncharacterized repeat protein (TIGR03806 family)
MFAGQSRLQITDCGLQIEKATCSPVFAICNLQSAICNPVLVLCLLLAGCHNREPGPAAIRDEEPPQTLSAYGLFQGNGSTQEPAAGVLPYDLNTPLFSDYATKYRFVRLPPGAQAQYSDTEVFEFPIGTTLVKTFAFLHDLTDPSKGRRLIETRLLIHKPDGWIGLTYVWNDEQTEATLQIAGGTRDVSWVHTDGRPRTTNYIIPNVNQCLGCHENSKVLRPLGLKARNLNKDFAYPEGPENQLTRWTRDGYFKDAQPPALAPRLPVWNDPATGTVDQRARAWLDINCAHCHNPAGPARNAGLDLRVEQTDVHKLGVRKSPVAAGRGSGGRSFDIVPGKPEESILLYRIQSTEPGVMMPELARRRVDEEGVALVRTWIASMN